MDNGMAAIGNQACEHWEHWGQWNPMAAKTMGFHCIFGGVPLVALDPLVARIPAPWGSQGEMPLRNSQLPGASLAYLRLARTFFV